MAIPSVAANPVVLVHLAGELGTKSARTRRAFLRALAENARLALADAGLRGQVRPEWSRLVVRGADPALCRQALSRVFGVHAAAEALEVPTDGLEQLVERVTPLLRERVRGRTFAVRPRRRGTAFTSVELARALGAALLPFSTGVDLTRPQVEVRVAAEPGRAFVELESTPGPDGLPLGTGGTAVALVSGGFDSPVAAWHVMRRGVRVEVLVCDLGGCGQVEAALAVARELSRWAPGQEMSAHVVDLAPVVAALVERVPGKLRQVLLKRAMYRVASRLALEVGAEAVVTGESLGQVSTQTLRNLAVCEEAAEVPILRPLIGLHKAEIMERAREIGTFQASEQVAEHCSIAEGHVVTWSTPERAKAGERLLPVDLAGAEWARAAVMARRTVRLRTWRPEPHEHLVDDVPPGAVVVDVREPEEGPTAGELRLPFTRALESLPELDPSRSYVLVCASGRRSEVLALKLRERGYAAFSLVGGVRRLRPRLGQPADDSLLGPPPFAALSPAQGQGPRSTPARSVPTG
jgi:thiamine biosynthesis protein ThiI